MPVEPNAAKAIFMAALEKADPAERAAYVAEACGGDAGLRRRVEELVKAHEAPGSFLRPPVATPAETGSALPDAAGATGSQQRTVSPGDPARLTVGGAGLNHPYLEIQALLRKRLRVATLIALGISLLFFALNFLRHSLDTRTVWLLYVPGGVFLAVNTVAAVLVWRLDAPSLRRLRVCEVVMFAVYVTYVAWVHYHTFFVTNAWFLQLGLQQPTEISLLARHASLTWLVIIVCYGTFIPNTGRRCAAVTIVIALVPLTLTAIGGFLHEIPARLVVICLIEMFMFMATAVAMAIFGSHKINALRQEALEARKLGQYQLKRRLGAGGMGEVYLAEHVLLRRPCAVKLIRPERAGDPAALRRFLREVQVTATLTHPNTVQVFDYGQTDDGTLYYAMEYLPGLTLEELVSREGPLPPARAVALLRQLCGALTEAHASGLIHRDLKPGNVILGSRGGQADVAKLLDFGLVHCPVAKGDETRLTHAGLIFGTPAYLSPEQAAGRLDLDARSDIYSLGALAYYLLTGRPPFVRPTAVQTVTAHLTDPVPPPSGLRLGVPPDLERVVLDCLEKEAGRRPATAAELDRRLGACSCAGEWSPDAAAAWWRDHPCPPASTIVF
jgi:eukaryotic-like serine/threonine-protein kinase